MELKIDHIGGFCPVQAEGTIDGVPFFFRARGSHWSIGIGEDPVGIMLGNRDGWLKLADYGVFPQAGYMSLEEATRIIEECAREFTAQKPS
jgi:hypothetical protein